MHTVQVSNDLYNIISTFAARDAISTSRLLKKAMAVYAKTKEDRGDYQASLKVMKNDDEYSASLELDLPQDNVLLMRPFFGIWKDHDIDGLEYQKQLRSEWER